MNLSVTSYYTYIEKCCLQGTPVSTSHICYLCVDTIMPYQASEGLIFSYFCTRHTVSYSAICLLRICDFFVGYFPEISICHFDNDWFNNTCHLFFKRLALLTVQIKWGNELHAWIDQSWQKHGQCHYYLQAMEPSLKSWVEHRLTDQLNLCERPSILSTTSHDAVLFIFLNVVLQTGSTVLKILHTIVTNAMWRTVKCYQSGQKWLHPIKQADVTTNMIPLFLVYQNHCHMSSDTVFHQRVSQNWLIWANFIFMNWSSVQAS